MIPLIIAGALFGGAAYAAYQLIQTMKQSGGNGKSKPAPPPEEPGKEKPKNPQKFKETRDPSPLLEKIVAGIKFSNMPVKIGERKVGEIVEPSLIPTGNIVVRPINSIGELTQVLPSAHALDDDVFFGQAASHSLLTLEHQQTTDVTEDVMGPPNKGLFVLQDTSGSMQHHNRIPWSLRLNRRLIEKCETNKARYCLIRFTGEPDTPVVGQSPAELSGIKSQLSELIAAGGGTNISNALLLAIKLVKEWGITDAKVVLVTDDDGSCGGSAMRNALSEAGIWLHSVAIGGSNEGLREISNKYDELSD